MRATAMMLSCLGLWLVGSGCGGDDDGAGSSGVPGDTPLAEVSSEQAQSLCEFAESAYKGSLPDGEDAYCRSAAARGASSTEECEQFETECKDFDLYDDDINEEWECEQAAPDYDGECTATVEEFEACIRARVDETEAFAANADCDDPSTFEAQDTPGACVTLLEKCEDISF